MTEYEDEFFEEELSDEEKQAYFEEASIIDKTGLLNDLNFRKRSFEKDAATDTKHSAAYYHTLLSLMDRFIENVRNTVFFDKLEPFWSYTYEITSEGITLVLSHYTSVDFDKDYNITGSMGDQDFELLSAKCRMLTIDEYAKQYGIENVTVRQWIRRGKIRTAKKYGKEWRIPELTDFPGRGYQFGQYKVSKEAVFPEPYAYISEYSNISFEQDKTDKSKYHISFSSRENRKHIVCDAKEREKIEILLIENPFVKFISDCFGNFA